MNEFSAVGKSLYFIVRGSASNVAEIPKRVAVWVSVNSHFVQYAKYMYNVITLIEKYNYVIKFFFCLQ